MTDDPTGAASPGHAVPLAQMVPEALPDDQPTEPLTNPPASPDEIARTDVTLTSSAEAPRENASSSEAPGEEAAVGGQTSGSASEPLEMLPQPPQPSQPLAVPAVEPKPAPVGETTETVLLLQRTLQRLQRLEDKFDSKIRNDESREAIVDRLHAEVQEYRADLLLKVLKPVLLDLIALHDDIGKIVALAAAPNSDLEKRLLHQVQGFQKDIEDILYRHGVEQYRCPGNEFDPRRQRAARTMPAPHPDLESKVTDRLRVGFACGEKVLRPEHVVVLVKPQPVSPLGGSSR
jgi:molecular chaperone GrpE